MSFLGFTFLKSCRVKDSKQNPRVASKHLQGFSNSRKTFVMNTFKQDFSTSLDSVTNTLELRSAQIFPKGAQKRQFFLFLKSAQFWGVVWSKEPNFGGLFGQKRPNSRIFIELFLAKK